MFCGSFKILIDFDDHGAVHLAELKQKRERCKGACFKLSAACFKENICSHGFLCLPVAVWLQDNFSEYGTIGLNLRTSKRCPPKRPPKFDLAVSRTVGTLAACHQTGGVESRTAEQSFLRWCACCWLCFKFNTPAAAGVRVDGKTLPAKSVVIAMGPWSGDATRWIPGVPRIGGQKAHSILVRPSRPVGADCLFAQVVTSSGENHDFDPLA